MSLRAEHERAATLITLAFFSTVPFFRTSFQKEAYSKVKSRRCTGDWGCNNRGHEIGPDYPLDRRKVTEKDNECREPVPPGVWNRKRLCNR